MDWLRRCQRGPREVSSRGQRGYKEARKPDHKLPWWIQGTGQETKGRGQQVLRECAPGGVKEEARSFQEQVEERSKRDQGERKESLRPDRKVRPNGMCGAIEFVSGLKMMTLATPFLQIIR